MLLISTDGIYDIDNTTMDVIEAMKYLNHHLKLQLFRSLDFNLMIKRKIICRLHDTLVLTSQGFTDTRGKDGKSHHVTTTFGPSRDLKLRLLSGVMLSGGKPKSKAQICGCSGKSLKFEGEVAHCDMWGVSIHEVIYGGLMMVNEY